MAKAIDLNPTINPNRATSKRSLWLDRNSLQGRLFLATLILLPVFLSASGYLLDRAFQQNLRSSESAQLQTQLYILLGATEWQDGKLWLPDELPEPKFSAVDSDLYAQISNGQQNILWRSLSQEYIDTPPPTDTQALHTGEETFAKIHSEDTVNHDYYSYRYDAIWETDQGKEQPLRFEIFHRTNEYNNKLRQYRQQLMLSLLLLSVGLISTQLIITRWGLQPLSLLARNLKNLSSNEAGQLEGHYPAEIQPVTDSLNHVLTTEKNQRERYKNTLGDLAHSLKTPLTVIQGELQNQSTQNNKVIEEQLQRMNDIIRHQLQRAVISSPNGLRNKTAVTPIIERLCAAMKKVYQDKNLTIEINSDKALTCNFDSQDLFELLGNLIENACKYGRNHVRITTEKNEQSLIISIEDNGDGVPEEFQQDILKRGARADTARPGQGIGLSVATDIVSAYNGSIRCDKSDLGGARFILELT